MPRSHWESAAVALLLGAAQGDCAQLPNFVVVLADDMGYGDWSRTGAPADTPHLDEMSRGQHTVWFQRAYAGNPICSPTRASVMTGRTPARTCIWGVEQHIMCRAGVGGCADSEYSIANATRERGYLSGFYGKWHLGSLSNRGVGSPDCYPLPKSGKCQMGYWVRDGGCCYGIDAKLDVSHPLHFGFDEFVATPECAASATTNCGCFFPPHPPSSFNGTAKCELGHYPNPSGFTECMQYYRGNASTGSIEPLPYITPVDDEAFLADQAAALIERSVAARRPFLAVIFFHGVHIPYIASPETRARYAARGMTVNEQDYWGTITQIDAQIGRLRALLAQLGVDGDTWVSITADNGPEVDPSGGQGTGSFPNPGRTDGLRGRKRDVTEGGTREIGLVEFPPAVKANRVEPHFPVITMDYMATILDLLGLESHKGRPLDGTSLLPVLRGEVAERPTSAGIGIHGIFSLGQTNHFSNGSAPSVARLCASLSAAQRLGDVPAGFSSAGNGPQFSWAEGNHLKIVGCRGNCVGTGCQPAHPGWHFFLYNLTADRAETHDLWEAERSTAVAMFRRFEDWQRSVWCSQGDGEIGCRSNPQCGQPPPTPLPPSPPTPPPAPAEPVPGMQRKKERCAADSPRGNSLGERGEGGLPACEQACRAAGSCHYISFSASCGCCWLYQECGATEGSDSYKYEWDTYHVP